MSQFLELCVNHAIDSAETVGKDDRKDIIISKCPFILSTKMVGAFQLLRTHLGVGGVKSPTHFLLRITCKKKRGKGSRYHTKLRM